MGNSYTRNDTSNNIADGNIINASDLDGEFDAIESAMGTSGHTHDGTAGEGGPITKLGPVQDLVVSASAVTPKTDNTLDLGSSSLEFKDGFFDGTVNADGLVVVGAADVTGDLDVDNININGNTISSTDSNGNITLAPNGTGVVALSSTDLTFGDNDKAIFGADSDMSLFHNGNNAFLDNDTGTLFIQTDALSVKNAAGTESVMLGAADGAVTLYHNNAAKLATTNTGVDITGVITADGAQIGGVVTINGTGRISSDGSIVYTIDSDSSSTDAGHYFRSDAGTNRFVVSESGDISFYADNGTTQGLFWDASTQRLGLGTTTPAGLMEVKVASGQYGATQGYRLVTADGGGYAVYPTSAVANPTFLHNVNSGESQAFGEGGVAHMTITSGGNVGIGADSPSEELTISKSDDARVSITSSSTSKASMTGLIEFDGSDGRHGYIGAVSGDMTINTDGGYPIKFQTTGSERLRIDSSGKVGIGSSAPDALLQIEKSDSGTTINMEPSSQSGPNIAIHNSNQTANNLSSIQFTNRGTNGVAETATAGIHVKHEAQGGTYSYGSMNFNVTNSAGSYATRMHISSAGNVGIGTDSASSRLHLKGDAYTTLTLDGTAGGQLDFYRNGSRHAQIFTDNAGGDIIFRNNTTTERMRIDSSGNLLVGKTSLNTAVNGVELRGGGQLAVTKDGSWVGNFNRKTSNGDIVSFQKDGTTVGSIGVDGDSTNLMIGNGVVGLRFVEGSNHIRPANIDTGGNRDNAIDLGYGSARFKDIYATNGTIQTSDQNEKQDIEELTDAEQRVAVAAKGLLRKYRWKDSVAEKGDDARIHFGIIAQDLKAAFEAEGLDAGRYAMFINSEWTDEETGEQKSRMGVRYNQLLAFIIAAI